MFEEAFSDVVLFKHGDRWDVPDLRRHVFLPQAVHPFQGGKLPVDRPIGSPFRAPLFDVGVDGRCPYISSPPAVKEALEVIRDDLDVLLRLPLVHAVVFQQVCQEIIEQHLIELDTGELALGYLTFPLLQEVIGHALQVALG